MAGKAPDYMVPTSFVLLDALPVSPNGKIDRRALPQPPRTRPALDVAWAAPRGPIEERIAAIWAETLDVEPVGTRDHFLDMGGHSLLAAQILARIADSFHVDIPLADFLSAPTVEGLAAGVVERLAARLPKEEMERLGK